MSTEFINSIGQQVTRFSGGRSAGIRFAIVSDVSRMSLHEMEELVQLMLKAMTRTREEGLNES